MITDTDAQGKGRRPTPFDRVTKTGRRHVNWAMAALFLAEGRTASEVAEAVGTSRTSLWRRLKGDGRFRATVLREKMRLEAEAAERVAGLRTIVADTIDMEVRAGNLRVILWLADRLNLLGAEDARRARAERTAERRRLLHDEERRLLAKVLARLGEGAGNADRAGQEKQNP